jgi:outer membrane protein OmpA-like peptidoglycan-associated protein
LDNIRTFLLEHLEIRLKISGHTDRKGNSNANLKLSQDRADAIKAYLLQSGHIVQNRILPLGFGDTKPIVQDEKTEEDRQLNRRVEVSIVR